MRPDYSGPADHRRAHRRGPGSWTAADIDDDEWDRLVAVNLTATMALLRAASGVLADGGSIIVVSSIQRPSRVSVSAYGATKAAVSNLVRSTGLEMAGRGVRCNIIAPGSTDTAMLHSMWPGVGAPEQSAEAVIAGTPSNSALASRSDGWRSRRTSPRRRSSSPPTPPGTSPCTTCASTAAPPSTSSRRRLGHRPKCRNWVGWRSEVRRHHHHRAAAHHRGRRRVQHPGRQCHPKKAEAEALRNRTYRPGDPFSTADDDAVRGDPRQLKPADLVDIRGIDLRRTRRHPVHPGRATGSRHIWTPGPANACGCRWRTTLTWRSCSGSNWRRHRHPGPPTIDFEGRRYNYDEDGAASFTSAGDDRRRNQRHHAVPRLRGRQRPALVRGLRLGWEAARGEVLARSSSASTRRTRRPRRRGDNAGRTGRRLRRYPGR